MSGRQGMTSGQYRETHVAESETTASTESRAARKMTFTENVIMTIKILAGFGLVGAALWAVSLWTAAE